MLEDPIESVVKEPEAADKAASSLNNWVAVTITLIATFLGICKIKDDNIVQAMQQAQADRIDHWSYYQSHNIREEIAKATLSRLRIAGSAEPVTTGAAREQLIAAFLALAISMLAITSLTQKRWLYGVALLPTALGALMGLAGLLGWALHPDFLIRWLS